MLFYDEEKENYAYSIYLTKEGLSYGYFYRQGGTDAYMEEGVKGVVSDFLPSLQDIPFEEDSTTDSQIRPAVKQA